MTASQTLSIVTIVRDDQRSIDRLLTSISRGAAALTSGQELEVIVVDDGSAAPVTVGARPFPVTVVRVDGAGNRSAARNAGAAAASGQFLAFVDADQELPSHWAEEHLAWHRERPGKLVAGYRRHVDQATSRWRPEVRTRVTSVYSENSSRIASAWYLAFSCNITVAADAFASVDGFDEGYAGWGFEDSDFGYRLHRLGVTTELSPRGWSLDHHHDVRLDDARVSGWERNRRRFLDRFPEAEAQATAAIDNYPTGTSSPPGQQWVQSFVAFEDRVRATQELPPLTTPTETVTVLSSADADDVRRRVAAGARINIVDGLNSSGLDRFVHDHPALTYQSLTDQ